MKSFKDNKRVYLLLEYVHGLDLDVILRNAGLLNNDEAAFYIACLIIILQYLHERDILYRDLKPENIMVGVNGFIKLVDFNSAKVTQGKTYTLVGCPYYTAPEVIAGKGYTKNSDIWSLGVLLYEFLCGSVPFGSNQEDPYKIYEEILENPIYFPEEIYSLNNGTVSLIRQLLNKYPENRHPNQIQKLQKHEFFKNFDWEELYTGNVIPPYKPVVPEAWDMSDENIEESQSWDSVLDIDSEESSESIPEINDDDIEDYRDLIAFDWDRNFN